MATQNTRYFIQVPVSLVSGKGLITTEKLVFGHIYTILNSNDKCFISNKKIGENIELSERSVSRAISKLKKVGLIDVHLIYKPDSKEIDKRYLTLSDRYLGCDTDDMGVVTPASIPSRHTCLYPHDTDGVGNKKINKEFNIYDDEEEALKTYSSAFGSPSDFIKLKIINLIKEHGSDVFEYAIDLAATGNAKSPYNFISKLLDDWKKHNLSNLEDVKSYASSFKQFKSKKGTHSHKPKKEHLPEWATKTPEERRAANKRQKEEHDYKMQHDPEYRKQQEKTDKDLEDNLRRIRELRKEKNYEW